MTTISDAIEAGNVHAIAARYLYHLDDMLRRRKAAVKYPGPDLPGEDKKREAELKTAIGRGVRGASRDPEAQRKIHRAGLELAVSTLEAKIEVERQFLADLTQELELLGR